MLFFPFLPELLFIFVLLSPANSTCVLCSILFNGVCRPLIKLNSLFLILDHNLI